MTIVTKRVSRFVCVCVCVNVISKLLLVRAAYYTLIYYTPYPLRTSSVNFSTTLYVAVAHFCGVQSYIIYALFDHRHVTRAVSSPLVMYSSWASIESFDFWKFIFLSNHPSRLLFVKITVIISDFIRVQCNTMGKRGTTPSQNDIRLCDLFSLQFIETKKKKLKFNTIRRRRRYSIGLLRRVNTFYSFCNNSRTHTSCSVIHTHTRIIIFIRSVKDARTL